MNPHDSAGIELHRRVDHDLSLHSPTHPYIGQVLDELRTEAKLFAHLLIDRCPPSRELSMALTDVEAALTHALAAIARYQPQVLADAGVPPDVPDGAIIDAPPLD